MTTVSKKQLLVDAINRNNGTAYLSSNVTFTNIRAEASSALGGTNSALDFSFANVPMSSTRVMRWNRVNLASVFAYGLIVTPTTETDLYSLLPAINAVYKLDLTDEDVVNVALPAYDPVNYSAPLSVTITAKTSSYAFYGTATLSLGRSYSGDSKCAYLIQNVGSNPTLQQATKTVKRYDSACKLDTSFKCLKNVTAISTWSVNDAYLTLNKNVVLSGSFGLTIGGVAVSGTQITINPNGDVIAWSNDPIYNNLPSKDICVNQTANVAYGVNVTTNTLYRFNADGVVDLTFNYSMGLIPRFIRVSDSGLVYIVSTTVNQLTTIDRMLPNGSKDTSFTAITITTPNGTTPHGVVDLVAYANGPGSDSGGCFYLYAPLGVSTASPIPSIRNIPLFTPPSDACGWLPIIKFSSSGAITNLDKIVQGCLNPDAIYSPTASSLTVNQKALVTLTASDTQVFITNKPHPYTAKLAPQISCTRPNTNAALMLRPSYDLIYGEYWTSLKEIVQLTDNLVIGYGAAKFINSNVGGYTNEAPAVVSYLGSQLAYNGILPIDNLPIIKMIGVVL